jgi:hypothetical protein
MMQSWLLAFVWQLGTCQTAAYIASIQARHGEKPPPNLAPAAASRASNMRAIPASMVCARE